MAYTKSAQETTDIGEGGALIGEILETLAGMIEPGIDGETVDQKAKSLIEKAGGTPAFLGYKARPSDPAFPSAICFCINEELVHGIASAEKIVKEGDIVSVDIGMKYKGLYTDTALTVAVGSIPKKTRQLLDVTKKALELGIAQAVSGNSVASIGKAIQEYVLPQGYGIVRDLVGHGVGHEVHEEPRVPNFYDAELEEWILEPGVVIAIEPMLTMGDHQVGVAEDGWSISTADKSLSAHFEHTVIVTDTGPLIATRRPSEV